MTFTSMRQGKLYEIYLLNLEWYIRQFKMYRASENRLFLGYTLDRWEKVGAFHSLINTSAPILIHTCYHFVSGLMHV